MRTIVYLFLFALYLSKFVSTKEIEIPVIRYISIVNESLRYQTLFADQNVIKKTREFRNGWKAAIKSYWTLMQKTSNPYKMDSTMGENGVQLELIEVGLEPGMQFSPLLKKFENRIGRKLSAIEYSCIFIFGDPFYPEIDDPFLRSPLMIRYIDKYTYFKFKYVVDTNELLNIINIYDHDYDKIKYKKFIDGFIPKDFLQTPINDIPIQILKSGLDSFQTHLSIPSNALCNPEAKENCNCESEMNIPERLLCPNFKKILNLNITFLEAKNLIRLQPFRRLILLNRYEIQNSSNLHEFIKGIIIRQRKNRPQLATTLLDSVIPEDEIEISLIFVNVTEAKNYMNIIDMYQIHTKERISNVNLLKIFKETINMTDPFNENATIVEFIGYSTYQRAHENLLEQLFAKNKTCLYYISPDINEESKGQVVKIPLEEIKSALLKCHANAPLPSRIFQWYSLSYDESQIRDLNAPADPHTIRIENEIAYHKKLVAALEAVVGRFPENHFRDTKIETLEMFLKKHKISIPSETFETTSNQSDWQIYVEEKIEVNVTESVRENTEPNLLIDITRQAFWLFGEEKKFDELQEKIITVIKEFEENYQKFNQWLNDAWDSIIFWVKIMIVFSVILVVVKAVHAIKKLCSCF